TVKGELTLESFFAELFHASDHPVFELLCIDTTSLGGDDAFIVMSDRPFNLFWFRNLPSRVTNRCHPPFIDKLDLDPTLIKSHPNYSTLYE
ncbi:MAG: hypothetical protein ACRC2V_10205, partial [Xenococcaceae cyanobacterium]